MNKLVHIQELVNKFWECFKNEVRNQVNDLQTKLKMLNQTYKISSKRRKLDVANEEKVMKQNNW